MDQGQKILFTALILLVDMLLFMLPITAFVVIYVIWARPVWFRDWVENLYRGLD